MDDEISSENWLKTHTRVVIIVVVALLLGIAVGIVVSLQEDKSPETAAPAEDVASTETTEPLKEPTLRSEEVVGGFSNIWDLVFLNQNTILFDERAGVIHGMSLSSKERWEITKLSNVRAEGEGGLLGLALDSEFSKNNFAYACYNATGSKRTVRVTRFKLSTDYKSASEFTDIIADIQSKGGRHSGCRLAMDSKSVLWVTTGDSAIGTAPQDPKSLGGKVLRVDRDGKAVSDNLPAPFDSRIFSYGHRNIQGLALLSSPLSNGAVGLTAEHGPDKEDEINWLLPGNFGWDPSSSSYDESVPMTNKTKYPDAVAAIWNSGGSTIAVSDMTFLTNQKWSLWRGWVAVATLKGKHVRMMDIKGNGTVATEKEILKDFGRIRAVTEGPDGNLYFTTDNSNGSDKIVRVIPN